MAGSRLSRNGMIELGCLGGLVEAGRHIHIVRFRMHVVS